MLIMTFPKGKKLYIIIGIVVVVAFFGIRSYQKANAPIQYDTVAVTQGTLVQTVEATGKIESLNDLSLRFEVPGIVDLIKVKENDPVKTGDYLANLRLSELNAAVAQASANLNQRLAGPSDEDRSYYEAAAEAARNGYEQSKIETANAIETAKAAVDTAKNNLQLAEGGEQSAIVESSYENAVASLQTALSAMQTGLTQADNILGVDNTLANDDFETYLSILDSSKINLAKIYYSSAKDAVNTAKLNIVGMNTMSPHSQIDAALTTGETALAKVAQLLSGVTDVLTATPPVGVLTQTTLDAKKTAIDSAKASVNVQYTAVISRRQAITDAKNSYSTYSIAYQKALRDLTEAEANAATMVAVKQAAYNQALATLNGKVNTPREVDVAAYRAILAQAIASRDKAIIRAPIDGIVTKVNKKRGEYISSAEPMIQMLSPHFEVKVDIPETDIPKLKLGDVTVIDLDAFGQDVKFTGKIVNIEPASTEIQDVVYYRVTITLDDTDKAIKPGMTANVKITTAQKDNVLSIPSRAVKTGATKTVRVLENNVAKEVVVETGLKADEGKVEIVSGLSAGQQVILGVKSAK